MFELFSLTSSNFFQTKSSGEKLETVGNKHATQKQREEIKQVKNSLKHRMESFYKDR